MNESLAIRDWHEPRISIIIPALNEARNLCVVLPRLPAVHQVVLVDGGSVDSTVETARSLMPSIEVVRQTRKGKGNALACGFAAATGDIIVMFDADGSADPAEIPSFVTALLSGADVAKGSRFCHGGGSEDITLVRKWGNAVLCAVTNLLMRTNYTDLCYGYNAFWRSVVPHLALPSVEASSSANQSMLWGDGFEIETLLNCRFAWAKFAIAEIPSVERRRIHGDSNLDAFSDGLRVLKTIWSEFRRSRAVAIPAHVRRHAPPADSAVVPDGSPGGGS